MSLMFLQRHKQLVKGGPKCNDDLRQDAVMQQFFALVNDLLAADAESARRRLHVPTFKVVAFKPKAGVMQWLDDTLSMHEVWSLLSRCMHSDHEAHCMHVVTSTCAWGKLSKLRYDSVLAV
jgi:phosphatidylinositol kinase/protein kinase (PI-3  family)